MTRKEMGVSLYWTECGFSVGHSLICCILTPQPEDGIMPVSPIAGDTGLSNGPFAALTLTTIQQEFWVFISAF